MPVRSRTDYNVGSQRVKKQREDSGLRSTKRDYQHSLIDNDLVTLNKLETFSVLSTKTFCAAYSHP